MDKPRVGDIYRLRTKDGHISEVVIERVDHQGVHYRHLGIGRKYRMGYNLFRHNSHFVERRLIRLRRACKRYKLTRVDNFLESMGYPV